MATSFVCRVMYPNNGLGTYNRIYSSEFSNVSGEYTCTVLTEYKEEIFGNNNICLKLERRSKPRTTAIVPVTGIRSNPSNKEHCQISIGDIYRVIQDDVLSISKHYDSYKSSFGVSQHFCKHSGLPKCSYNHLQQLHVLSSELTKCIVASVTSPSFQQTVASTKEERLKELRTYFDRNKILYNHTAVFYTESYLGSGTGAVSENILVQRPALVGFGKVINASATPKIEVRSSRSAKDRKLVHLKDSTIVASKTIRASAPSPVLYDLVQNDDDRKVQSTYEELEPRILPSGICSGVKIHLHLRSGHTVYLMFDYEDRTTFYELFNKPTLDYEDRQQKLIKLLTKCLKKGCNTLPTEQTALLMMSIMNYIADIRTLFVPDTQSVNIRYDAETDENEDIHGAMRNNWRPRRRGVGPNGEERLTKKLDRTKITRDDKYAHRKVEPLKGTYLYKIIERISKTLKQPELRLNLERYKNGHDDLFEKLKKDQQQLSELKGKINLHNNTIAQELRLGYVVDDKSTYTPVFDDSLTKLQVHIPKDRPVYCVTSVQNMGGEFRLHIDINTSIPKQISRSDYMYQHILPKALSSIEIGVIKEEVSGGPNVRHARLSTLSLFNAQQIKDALSPQFLKQAEDIKSLKRIVLLVKKEDSSYRHLGADTERTAQRRVTKDNQYQYDFGFYLLMRPPAAKDDPYTTSDDQYEDPERPQKLFEIPVTVSDGTNLSDLHFYFNTQSTQCYLVSKEDTKTFDKNKETFKPKLKTLISRVEEGKNILAQDIGSEPVVQELEKLKDENTALKNQLKTVEETLIGKHTVTPFPPSTPTAPTTVQGSQNSAVQNAVARLNNNNSFKQQLRRRERGLSADQPASDM